MGGCIYLKACLLSLVLVSLHSTKSEAGDWPRLPVYTNHMLFRIPERNLNTTTTACGKHNLAYIDRVVADLHEFVKTDVAADANKTITVTDIPTDCTNHVGSDNIEQVVRKYTVPTRAQEPLLMLSPAEKPGKAKCPDLFPAVDVERVWRQNVTGSNVTIGVVGTGIYVDDPDIKDNVNPHLSFNFAYDTNEQFTDEIKLKIDSNPKLYHDLRQGSQCARLAAGVRNDANCSSGVAYDASIAGLVPFEIETQLDDQTDEIRVSTIYDDVAVAKAWNNKSDEIDVYMNSWGRAGTRPWELKPAGTASTEALQHGVLNGRQGHGSIYVVPSGDGGKQTDCNSDGLVNSIYTLTINSIDKESVARVPPYAENCASTIASAPGKVKLSDQSQVIGDTSASVAVASGVIALSLQVNPSLTWRDMQHIIVNTSTTTSVSEDGWKINSAGHPFHPVFGFGVMNASAMVEAAKEWKTVPGLVVDKSDRVIVEKPPRPVPEREDTFEETVTIAMGLNDEKPIDVNYIEQVVLETKNILPANLTSVTIRLTSPANTESLLYSLQGVDFEQSDASVQEWNLTSVNFWGEQPRGNWTLRMEYVGSFLPGTLNTEVVLMILGTKTDPSPQRSPESPEITTVPGEAEPKPRASEPGGVYWQQIADGIIVILWASLMVYIVRVAV